MVGRALVAEVRRRGWPALALSHEQADIASGEAVSFWVKSFAPETIFNCAAYTAVDACEKEREQAMAVNGEAVGTIAAAATAAGCKLVQLSSDYVFDGAGARPYHEQDSPAPLSVYGESKLLGERRAAEDSKALIVRSSWIFGVGGGNFVATMVRLMRQGKVPLRVVEDQTGGPTFAPFLAAALCDLVQAGATGIVHYRNREPVSWYNFATEIAGLWDAGVEVLPVTTDQMPRPAPRPPFSVLDVTRFEEITGRRVEPWGWGLGSYLQELRREAGEIRPFRKRLSGLVAS